MSQSTRERHVAQQTNTGEPLASNKIHYQSAYLLDDCPRGLIVDGTHAGVSSASTTWFTAKDGFIVSYDPSTGLVTIANKEGAYVDIPRERVRRLVPKAPEAK